jgi:hypothetical protein
MQRLSSGSLIICALTLALPAAAQVEHPPVPVEKAAYHWPVFSNEHVMVLRVYFPPGRGSNYHIHSLDQISVQVEAGANAGQVWGEEPTLARPGTKGQVGFTAYSKKRFIHKSTNTAATPYQNIVIALLKPKPADLAPAARPDGYVQVFDNERAAPGSSRSNPDNRLGQSPKARQGCVSSSTAARSPRSFPASQTAAWRSGSVTSMGRSRARRAAYVTSELPASRSPSSN